MITAVQESLTLGMSSKFEDPDNSEDPENDYSLSVAGAGTAAPSLAVRVPCTFSCTQLLNAYKV